MLRNFHCFYNNELAQIYLGPVLSSENSEKSDISVEFCLERIPAGTGRDLSTTDRQ